MSNDSHSFLAIRFSPLNWSDLRAIFKNRVIGSGLSDRECSFDREQGLLNSAFGVEHKCLLGLRLRLVPFEF